MANQRNQTAPTTINAGNVANIAKAWTFDASVLEQSGVLNGGTFQNTPVVSDGCVYLASSTGFVFALNADNGQRVWTSDKMPGATAGSLVGGVITGSPAVANGRVYVGVASLNDPKVVAIDQATGKTLWVSHIMDPTKHKPEYRTDTITSPVVWNGLIFQGIMADENSGCASQPGVIGVICTPQNPRGGYAILEESSGQLLHQDWTITDAEFLEGYRGASIWCTAAMDAATGYAYACGGNPASKQKESRWSNALLKIDMNRTSPTFGKIVDAYKGNVDQYYPGLDRQPACEQVPTTLLWSPTCVQLDLDFGASPSLYTITVGGEPVTLLGDLQKSGIYHSVYADNMEMRWTAVVGAPCPSCNAASPAVDGTNVYTVGVPGPTAWALSRDRGGVRWAQPLGSGNHFQPTSTANGVVYTMDNLGVLHAFDAATGLILKRWPVSLDVGNYAGDLSSQGVSIARNTVFAASGRFVVAYR